MHAASLRYFYEAAQAGSMRAAGDRLGVAVSSISRQIAQLEAEYGVPLIERGRRSIKLTQAGELAISYYRRSLAEKELFDSQLQNLRGLKSGRVDLAMGEGFINSDFAKVLNTFLTKHSGIFLSLTSASTSEIIRMVSNDEVHAGLIFHFTPDPSIRVRASVERPTVLLLRPDHPLANHEKVTLADIAPYRVCLPPEGFRIRQLVAQAEAAEGVWLKNDLVANSLHLLKEMVKAGGCVALLPKITAAPELASGALKAIPIATPALESSSINLITRVGRQLAPAPMKLLTILAANFRSWS